MNLQGAVIYLPQDRRLALARGEMLPDHAHGVALFADISGFTPLAEALARAYGNQRGSEALLRQLDQVFEALIAQLDCCGGSVINFMGDAITCWFDDVNAVTGSSASAAVTCAVKMEKAMQAFSSVQIPGQPPVALAVKVMAASGPARRFVVGDPDIQLIDTLAGQTLDRMAAADPLTRPGEILVDEATAAAWPVRERRTHPSSGDSYCVIDLNAPVFAALEASDPRPMEDFDAQALQTFRPYVLSATWERIEFGLGDLMTELRPAAALFLRFSGIDYDGDEEAGAKLDALIRRAQGVMSAYDGTLLQFSNGDKGSYFYASFGAPVAHEDDILRAARAAIDLRAELSARTAGQDHPAFPPVQIGISHGMMYTGSYGSSTRRTYGVIGDDVTTAARLMSKAEPGDILVSPRVRNATANTLVYEPRAPVLLKGKAEPMPVFAAIAPITRHALRLEEPSYALPMIGRSGELETIAACLERAAAGQGQVIGIRGDPGLGKSRLAAEATRLAHRRGFTGYGGACQSASASYQVWKPVWQAFFGVDPDTPLRRQLRHLEGEIEDRAPDRVEALPLLGPVLGLALPDNEFTRALDFQARQSAMEALLLDCLAAEARQSSKGLLLVLEDLHWIDPASLELLKAVVARITDLPILVIAAYRPLGLRGTVSSLHFAERSNFTEITLKELSDEESILVIRAKLAQLYPERSGALPGALIERVRTRAQGNPFYLEELLNWVHDRNISLDNAQAIQSLELPAGLHSLILSRIDQFSTRQQITLKAASVIGRVFRYSHLSGYYPPLEIPEHPLREDLDLLAQFEITPVYDTAELEYLFKHIITQEVAYETLPFATRAALHEQYAAFIEKLQQEDLAQPESPLNLLDLLAHHYGLSANQAKQIEYFRRAADAAARAFANAAAARYYERMLPLVDENDQREVRLRLARVHRLTGAWEECKAILQQGLQSAEKAHDDLATARFQSVMGDLSNKQNTFEQSLKWLAAAQKTFEAHGAEGDLCDALLFASEARCSLGHYPEALADAEKARELASAAGDRARLFRALGQCALIYHDQGDLEAALPFYNESYDLAFALGDRRGMINALNNRGVIAVEQGDFARALEVFGRAYSAAFEIGSRLQMSIAAGNLGELYLLYGADSPAGRENAGACFEHSLSLSLAIGDTHGVAEGLWHLGKLFGMQGDLYPGNADTMALEVLEQAVVLARALKMPYELCDYRQAQAEQLGRCNRPREARAANDEARAMAQEIGREDVVFRCEVLAPLLRLALHESSASEAARDLMTLCDSWSGDELQAELDYQAWKLLPGHPDGERARAQAAERYERLIQHNALQIYRERLRELSGWSLPVPALPPLPPVLPPARGLGPLRAQVRALIQKR